MSYVFAPTANGEKRDEKNFRKIVEYIGSKQAGIGSNTAKGLRYIKNELGCSGAAIKFLYKSSKKILNHNIEQYGTNVYRYNEFCCGIIGILIEHIPQYIEDNSDKIELNKNSKIFNKFDWLFFNQYVAIKWVENENYQQQREKASEIISRLECFK